MIPGKLTTTAALRFRHIIVNTFPFCKSLLLLWLLGGFASLVHAQDAVLLPDGGLETPVSRMMTGTLSNGPIAAWGANVEMITTSPRFHESSRSFRNLVTFSIREESLQQPLPDFTASVTLLIKYKASYQDASYQSLSQTLTLAYKGGESQLSDARHYFPFQGAEVVSVTVTNMNFPAAGGGIDYRNILQLETTIFTTRYYTLSSTAFTLGTASVVAGDVLPVNWTAPATSGHNAVQLEWAWLENELEPNYSINNVFTTQSKEKLLTDGATRIELGHSATAYKIPMLYDGEGKLHYRVRGVSIQPSGTRRYTPWSAIQSVAYTGHESALNWQVTTSFAEEGKHKTVIQYYDGSLRPRQTVTKDNASQNTVTAETLYDNEGRAAIQILPAPGISNIMAYQRNLHKFNSPDAGIPAQGDNSNPADYFDYYFTSSATPSLLTTVNGSAAQYYSPNNPQAATAAKYLPDAEGYPYTVTRYTPDGTGRIQSQSGVGATFRMGSGRETKCYYGSPKQEELDALFGTEVGDKSHYFKNMVQDANGQMSVSYTDMHGRTIATALAGEAPANLAGLDVSNAAYYTNQHHTTPLTLNLLDENSNAIKGNAIESVNTLLVPYNTTYNFTYTLTPEKLSLPACSTSTPVCYDCRYDLEFAIIDESGDRSEPVLLRRFHNLAVENPSTNCNTAVELFRQDGTGTASSTIQFSTLLSAGSYSIRKTLTLSEKSLETFKADYQSRGTCERSLSFLIDSVYQSLKAITKCGEEPASNQAQMDCNNCTTSLGTPAAYRTAYLSHIGFTGTPGAALEAEITASYEAAKKSCDLLCDITPVENMSKRDMMLADMIPFAGQYARESLAGTMAQKYNIFSLANTATQPFYKKPKKSNGAALGDYLTEQGQPDPSIKDILATTTPQDFTELFQDKWAEALLPYHPEYARLVYAETSLTPSYNWMATLDNVPTYSAAEAGGYLFTTGAQLIAKDPFFTLAGNSTAVGGVNWTAQMETKIVNNYMAGQSMWQYAYQASVCNTSPQRSECQSANINTIPKKPPFTTVAALTTAEKDALWSVFKDYYRQARMTIMDAYVAAKVPLPANDHNDLVNQQYIVYYPKDYNERINPIKANSGDAGDWSFWSAGSATGGAPTVTPGSSAASTQAAAYAGRCSGYINQWKQALLQCAALKAHPQSAAIVESLTIRMRDICIQGSDQSNPAGATEVAPAIFNVPFRSFEALINYVLIDSLGIAKTDLCNPYVIESPGPYGMNRQPAPVVATAVEKCNCDRFANIRQWAIHDNVDPANFTAFNQYLKTYYGDTLSRSLYDALQRCSILNTPTGSNCQTTYTTVSAPCGTNPCDVDPEAPAMQQMAMLTMQEGEIILTDTSGKKIIDAEAAWAGPYCDYLCPVTTCTYTYPPALVLPEPVVLPSFMLCGYTAVQRCYSCGDIAALISQFKSVFPEPYRQAPYAPGTELNDVQLAYMENMARYLNYKTGMDYSWHEYMQASDTAGCAISANAGKRMLCRKDTPLNDPTGVFTDDDPCQATYDMALHIAQYIFDIRWKRRLADFEQRYRSLCMAAGKRETFTVSYVPKEYHYTLYYYDQAGNLIKTIPPAGVKPDYSASYLAEVKTARAATTTATKTPQHVLPTQYRYNTLNQVVAQFSPDGSTSKFWYDRLGRLVVSQNAKQVVLQQYSYTLYDDLGRITEVGQLTQNAVMNQLISQNSSSLADWVSAATAREQITQTVYDQAYTPATPDPGVGGGLQQRHLRSRVSYTLYKNQYTDASHYTATFYSYDLHGNVDQLLQDYRGVAGLPAADRFKLLQYRYDLISGKVNEVAYQPGAKDAFYHRYRYDAENRLTEVYTSRDRQWWDRDAAYSYYRHGPLARTVLGQLQVQGLDYAYTLQGWLKGVNSSSLNPAQDIGQDGMSSSAVARDIYGFALHYYDNNSTERDYKPVGLTDIFARPNNAANFKSLYNGNIAAMTVNNGGLKKGPAAATNSLPLLYNYGYDQLNRLVSMQAYKGLNEATNQWIPVAIEDYKEQISYDANGNIRTYKRNGSPSIAGKQTVMDDLAYSYYTGTNQLQRVNDILNYSSYYTEDVDHQPNTDNYEYDKIGNLVKDNAEGITNISWTVYGKIASIVKNGATISYSYDAAGNRITKTAGGVTTLYVRDASGNVMSVYELPAANTITQKEVHLYGSSRLGIAQAETETVTEVTLASGFGNAVVRKLTRGNKFFELSNHLGNVLATITDRKLIQSSSSQTTGVNNGGCVPGTALDELVVNARGTASTFTARMAVHLEAGFETDATDEVLVYTDAQQSSCVTEPPANVNTGTAWYAADVVSAVDYAPFGMALVGRSYSSEKYRYGFNGKENDKDMNSLTAYDYGFRIYNPGIGRFLSVDPLTKEYPELTPYQFASNVPISGIDLDGLEFYYAADGKFLGQGSDPKNLEVRLAKDNGLTKSGKQLVSSVDVKGKAVSAWIVIHRDHKQFLDRAHMVYGEGGNNGINADGENPALYFAWAFENFKNNGLSKPQTEEDAKNRAWRDATKSYKNGTIQTAGKSDSPYNLFNNARKKIESENDGSALRNLPGAENVVAAVISVLLKSTNDPTKGGYQWVGGPGTGDNNDTWNNRVSDRVPTAKVNTSSKYYQSFTVFYRFKTNEEKTATEKNKLTPKTSN